MHNAVIHKYSGDKMAPFLASEMARVCHACTIKHCYISETYSI